jgi:hypothetical protein
MPKNRARTLAIARRRRRDPGPRLPWLVLALGLAACAGLQTGHAQTGPAAQPPPSTDRANPPAEAQRPVQPPPTGTGSQETGVIRPPAGVDPGMTKPAPNPQAFPMPVVPPPGTPGGNPQVVPK